MKAKIITLFVFFFIYTITNAQDCEWAQNPGGSGDENGNGITTDAAGNVYTIGRFTSDTITFGATTLTNTGAAGTGDLFIVKYNSSGTVLWAKSAGGTGNEVGYKISTDTSGNVYITGYFGSPSISFGSTTFTNASSFGTNDIFIVKYDAAGTVIWAKSATGSKTDYSGDITTDAAGNVYLTGYFYSPVLNLGSISLTNTVSGTADMFLVKYDPSGNILWAKSSTGTNGEAGMGLCIDVSGNIYVTGNFYSATASFDSITLTNAGPTSTEDAFIAKYSSSGNVIWAISAGGTYYDFGTGLSTDASGNLYATGSFLGSSITFGSTTLYNAGGASNDIYLVKYDPAGTVLWAKSAGGSYSDVPYGIATDASTGDVLITGFFNSDTLSFESTALVNAGLSDIFMTKYDPAGNVLWAERFGGSAEDLAQGATADMSGNMYVTGYIRSTVVVFDTTTLSNTGPVGTYDAFVVKIHPNSIILGSTSFAETTNETIQIYPNPTSSSATIIINPGSKIQNAGLKIYDVSGQEIKNITGISGNQININRDDLQAGIYFITLTQNNKVIASDKLIITD